MTVKFSDQFILLLQSVAIFSIKTVSKGKLLIKYYNFLECQLPKSADIKTFFQPSHTCSNKPIQTHLRSLHTYFIVIFYYRSLPSVQYLYLNAATKTYLENLKDK